VIRSARREAPTRSAKERGAVLVEFAFVGPVLFLMIIGLLDFSLIIVGNTVGTNAAREGSRVGIINYVGADISTSANHQLIVAAVKRRLAGLVRDDITISVRCVSASEPEPHVEVGGVRKGTIPCTAASVTPGADLLEVRFTWRHIGASPFVSNTMHDESAMAVIQGQAAYTGASTTTTMPNSCDVTSFTTSPTNRTLRIWQEGTNAGQIKANSAPIDVFVSSPGCSGTVTMRIPGAPVPYAAGVAMDVVSVGSWKYQIGGSNWSTGSYTVTLGTGTGAQTFSLTVTT